MNHQILPQHASTRSAAVTVSYICRPSPALRTAFCGKTYKDTGDKIQWAEVLGRHGINGIFLWRFPSEKYDFVTWDDIPNIWKVVKFMFQTTNQIFMRKKCQKMIEKEDLTAQLGASLSDFDWVALALCSSQDHGVQHRAPPVLHAVSKAGSIPELGLPSGYVKIAIENGHL